MTDKLRAAAQAAYKAMIAAELSDGSKREWEAAVDGLKAALAEPAPVQVNWNKPELNKLRHSDHCRYWNDGEFCTCGALEYEEIKFWKNKVLAQPEQEPVAWMSDSDVGFYKEEFGTYPCVPLYTAPPRREWVGLTDDDKTEIKKLVTYDQFETAGEYANRVQAATESKLKEKNCG